jgi:hypothetical protein
MCRRLFGLEQGNPHDLFGDAGDLDIHLQRSHTFRGARHLEVHVAKVVLVAQDVGEHGKALAFLDETHGDAGAGCLHRHARIHQRQR